MRSSFGFLRVVHVGRSTCQAISGQGGKSARVWGLPLVDERGVVGVPHEELGLRVSGIEFCVLCFVFRGVGFGVRASGLPFINERSVVGVPHEELGRAVPERHHLVSHLYPGWDSVLYSQAQR